MNWLLVNEKEAPKLELHIDNSVKAKISAGEFSEDDVKYIRALSFMPKSDSSEIPHETLEHLRRACQLWDINIRLFNITSHRKIVGPFIVALKKLLFPVLRVLLKDFINQQRAFNAQVISTLHHLSQQIEKSRSQEK